MEEWKDCEELKPKPKEKLIFVDKKLETKHRTRWCVEANQVSMYEMWERQHVHQDARKMHKAKNTCQHFWEMEKATFGRPR